MKCRGGGGGTRRGWVFLPTSFVLYRFLRALQQNRAQPRLYLFYAQQPMNFLAQSANVLKPNFIFLMKESGVSVHLRSNKVH